MNLAWDEGRVSRDAATFCTLHFAINSDGFD